MLRWWVSELDRPRNAGNSAGSEMGKSNNEKQPLLPSFSSAEEVSLGSRESSHAIPSFLCTTYQPLKQWRYQPFQLCASSPLTGRTSALVPLIIHLTLLLWYDCFSIFRCSAKFVNLPYMIYHIAFNPNTPAGPWSGRLIQRSAALLQSY